MKIRNEGLLERNIEEMKTEKGIIKEVIPKKREGVKREREIEGRERE